MRGLKLCPTGCPIMPNNFVVPLNTFFRPTLYRRRRQLSLSTGPRSTLVQRGPRRSLSPPALAVLFRARRTGGGTFSPVLGLQKLVPFPTFLWTGTSLFSPLSRALTTPIVAPAQREIL